MIGLSSQAKQTLAVMLAVATSEMKFMPTHEIALRTELSVSYIEQIIRKLKAASLLLVRRGPNGGYTLNKDARDINLLEIMSCSFEASKVCREMAMSDGLSDIWPHSFDIISQAYTEISLYQLITPPPKN